MPQTVLPQLQDVIKNLEAQESTLSQQLEEIRAKREAVAAVLPMFGDELSAVDRSEPEAPAVAAEKVDKKSAAAKNTKATKKTPASTAKKPKATPKSKTSTTSKKKDGRAASWQKYALPGVKDRPMPEAVQIVLATKPNDDFKIAEVMSALFKEGMPKAQYLKARNRISNILSGGVRDGEWFKGDRGAYRLNKPA